MSPANIDDTSGPVDPALGRPLTRKELRAREKSLDTGMQGAVPEQAYETELAYGDTGPQGTDGLQEPGHSHPAATAGGPAAEVPPPPAVPPAVPAPPASAPATGAVPVHAEQVQGDPVPAAPDAPPSIQEHHPAESPAGQHPEAGHHAAPHGEVFAADDHRDHHEAAAAPPAAHEYAGDPHYSDPAQYPDGHEYHDDAGHGHEAYHADPHPDDAHGAGYHDDGTHHGEPAVHSLIAGSSATKVVARPSKKVRRRRRLLALFLTLAVFVTAVAVGAQFLKPLLGDGKPSDFPGPGAGEVQVTVDNGEGTRSVATDLESKGVIANADTFLQAFSASGGTLSPGDYTFKSEMKNKDAVDVLLGQDKTKVIYFALSAGLRINESLQAIAQGSGISIQQLQALSNDPAQFGLPAKAKNLEGYLFPGEYRFPLGTSGKDILKSLVDETVKELQSQGISDPGKQYESVIVASIVQAEGGQAEYGDVAGAIYNRLKPNDQTGGFLQVDSAVTYGLGTKSYNFTDEQRQDKSNPYNTYANPGLPPGPIGSPGKTAIDAAARPKTNDYLFWVTVNLDTKETKFARTLAEHNVYVEEYNSWCRANAGRCT